MGIALGCYVGSYFLCVTQVTFGPSRGDRVAVSPAYWNAPKWLGAPALYQPIHFLDRSCLRRSMWQTRPAKNGELDSNFTGSF